MTIDSSVRLEHWGSGDGDLLRRLLGVPEMTLYLGGPETPAKLAERQARYENPATRAYRIVAEGMSEGVGWVGYWEHTKDGQDVWEVGWSVVPEFQGRGVATSAMRLLLEMIREQPEGRRFVHAYPSVDNGASNGVCRKLGFMLLGAYDAEYPPGNPVRLNDWRYHLFPEVESAGQRDGRTVAYPVGESRN